MNEERFNSHCDYCYYHGRGACSDKSKQPVTLHGASDEALEAEYKKRKNAPLNKQIAELEKEILVLKLQLIK